MHIAMAGKGHGVAEMASFRHFLLWHMDCCSTLPGAALGGTGTANRDTAMSFNVSLHIGHGDNRIDDIKVTDSGDGVVVMTIETRDGNVAFFMWGGIDEAYQMVSRLSNGLLALEQPREAENPASAHAPVGPKAGV